jgi:putative transposase
MPSNFERQSLRLKGYDYSQTGAYFVTLCVQGRKNLFGRILDGNLELYDNGMIIQGCWQDLPLKYPTIILDYFTVMPNHVHGIISLVGAGSPRPEIPAWSVGGETPPLPMDLNLSTIIGYFKYQSTKLVNESRRTPGARVWQRGFYDHVIRDDESLNRIREYIITNSRRWHLDRENPEACKKDDFDLWLNTYKIPPSSTPR